MMKISNLKFQMSNVLLFLASVLLMLFVIPKSTLASTLYLSPGSGNIYIGGTTSVQVRLNAGGDAVNGVSAFLSYPADKLDVAWVSSGSAFAIEAEKTYGGGIIKISRGNIGGVTGNVNVATIGFRGKSAGSATVAFIGGSQAPRASDSSDSLNLGGSRGSVFNVIAGSPPAAKTGTTKASPGTAIAQLLINEIRITDISTNSAVISWKTNGESDSLVDYGVEKDKYFLSASDGNLTLNHSIKLENPFLTAGKKLHFRIKSKDNEEREVGSEDQTLQLVGYQVRIKVVDEADNPVSGVEVWLYSEPLKAVTDANGEAIFDNVALGQHLAVVKSSNGDQSVEVQVSENNALSVSDNTLVSTASATVASKGPVYSTIKISRKSTAFWALPQILLPAGLIIVLAAGGVIVFIKRRKKKADPPTSSGTTAPVMVTPVNPNTANVPRPPNINQSG